MTTRHKLIQAAVIVVAAAWCSRALCGGWETIVLDMGPAVRVVNLFGLEGNSQKRAVMISCGAAEAGVADRILVTAGPAKVFHLRPGDQVQIEIAGTQIAGNFGKNDSVSTTAVAELEDVDGLLSRIAAAAGDSMVVLRAEGYEEVVSLPRTGLEEAIGTFSTACAY